jgi:hypothetical protein
MKNQVVVFIGIIVACLMVLGGSSAFAGDELSTEEATMLFSGKTVEGINVNKGYSFKAYFDPDGTIRAEYAVGERQGKWRIDNKGRKCVKWEDKDKENCNIIVNDEGVYKEIKVKKNGKRKHTATFKKFTDGNLYDL